MASKKILKRFAAALIILLLIYAGIAVVYGFCVSNLFQAVYYADGIYTDDLSASISKEDFDAMNCRTYEGDQIFNESYRVSFPWVWHHFTGGTAFCSYTYLCTDPGSGEVLYRRKTDVSIKFQLSFSGFHVKGYQADEAGKE